MDVGDEALDFLTTAEVAARLRVSKMTVRRLFQSGDLESVKVGRSRRFAPEAVADYKDRLREAARLGNPAA